MKNKIVEFIKGVSEDNNKLDTLEKIYELNEQLQYAQDLHESATILFNWFKSTYSISNLQFSLFDFDTEESKIIFKEGKEYYLDDKEAFYFIVNTHTQINAVISFCADNLEHYDELQNDYDAIEVLFYQISPTLQNSILKKYYLEVSSIDSVTNVYNRNYLIEHLKKTIALTNKEDKKIAFLMIGIDRFKAVIEEFDYDIGDKVLIELAKTIHKNVKGYDIVARLTGDEFLVALVNNPNIEIATQIAQTIIHEFEKLKVIVNERTGQVLQKTICIGISLFPDDTDDMMQAIKNADYFLSEAKNKGRSQFAVYKKEDESYINLF